MKRPVFIAGLGGVMACSLAARAQQRPMRLVGFLCSATAEGYKIQVATFRQALNESGYYEGRDVVIEFRFAENPYDRLAALARDLVQRRLDVIVAAGATNTGLAAKEAARDVPIGFVGGSDPIQFDLVSNLARPGGNVTAVTSLWRQRHRAVSCGGPVCRRDSERRKAGGLASPTRDKGRIRD